MTIMEQLGWLAFAMGLVFGALSVTLVVRAVQPEPCAVNEARLHDGTCIALDQIRIGDS